MNPEHVHPGRVNMVRVPAGTFAMGNVDAWAYPGDGEGPVHDVALAEFRIAATVVSNAEFAEFVDATGHVTDAEQYVACTLRPHGNTYVGDLGDERLPRCQR